MPETAQNNWRELFPGLLSPPPRRVKPGGGPILLHGLALVFLLFGLACVWYTCADAAATRSLITSGTRVSAVVISHDRHYGKNSYFAIKFQFSVKGREQSGTEDVDESTFYRVHDGENIPVVYNPAAPSECKIASQLEGAVSSDFKTGLSVMLVFLLVGGICEYSVIQMMARPKTLARSGILAEAVITEMGDLPAENGRPMLVDVAYSFEVDGSTYKGGQRVNSMVCGKWKVGDSVPTLYNASNPEDSVLYPGITDIVRL